MAFDHEPCIGVVGGGQLGRMLALEARRMGWRVVQWTGGDNSGASRLSDYVLTSDFSNEQALEEFCSLVSCATVEFENIPRETLDSIATKVPTFPSSQALHICQHREREKHFLRENGIPTAKFQIVNNAEELQVALESMPFDTIIKTCQFGYDGKGQMMVPFDKRPSASEIWPSFEGGAAIVEQKVDLAAELSVMVVRGQNGEVVTYDPAENEHLDHILHLSIVPARLSVELQEQAQEIAVKVVEALDYVGVIGVEFFLDSAGNLLVNEMACRPHNSGHHTLDACETSQFEQQLRAVSGLPLGGTELLKPVVMLNLLGDLWESPQCPPDWSKLLSTKGAKLHLYGKSEAKPKRKMGHATFTDDTVEQAIENALENFKSLN